MLPPVSLRWRHHLPPKTGPGSLCAVCCKPFTAQEWERRHTTGSPDAQRYTHPACCWCEADQ